MTRLPDALDLGDEVVRLRPWRRDDVDELTAIWQDAELRRRFGVDEPVTTESIRAYVEGVNARWRDGAQLSLAVLADATLVGGCDLDHLDAEPPDLPDLGYWIAAPARGNGYAMRAAQLLLECAALDLDLAEISLEVEPDNRASIAVAERLGFTRLAGVERSEGARRLAVYVCRVGPG